MFDSFSMFINLEGNKFVSLQPLVKRSEIFPVSIINSYIFRHWLSTAGIILFAQIALS